MYRGSIGKLSLITCFFGLLGCCGNFCLFVWGCHEHWFGIGADAVPAGQRPGPILLPWADCRLGTSEPDLARTQCCNHRLRCQSVMELDLSLHWDYTLYHLVCSVVNSLLGNPAAPQQLFACCVSLRILPAYCDSVPVCCIYLLEEACRNLGICRSTPKGHQ